MQAIRLDTTQFCGPEVLSGNIVSRYGSSYESFKGTVSYRSFVRKLLCTALQLTSKIDTVCSGFTGYHCAMTGLSASEKTPVPAILLDLDGTLMDSNYEHIAAWHEAFRSKGLEVPNARIHRCVGMSGRLMVRALFTELGRNIAPRKIEQLEQVHKRNFVKKLEYVHMLPGARELLRDLSRRGVKWAIATGGDRQTVERMIKPLLIPAKAPVITADHVEKAKPDPDVFLMAARRLGVELRDCIVVGDSVWDILGARRAKALGVGLLCGGYSAAELERAGAYRVYKDPADLHVHLSEIGIQPD